jgi:ethanolamine kinase
LQDWTPPSAFQTIENWLQTEVLSIRFDDEPERAAVLESINIKAIADEVASMKHLLLEKLPAPPVVFCHNDLLSGNIMLHEKPDSTHVFLIDFEYSCHNFRCVFN